MAQGMTTKALMEYIKTLGNGGGGGSSVTSYNELTDKPSIEGVTLAGNKTYDELNLVSITNTEIEALTI